MTERNRELLGLVPAAVLVTAGFAAVFIQREEITNLTGTAGDELRATSLTYGALFLGLCVAMHLVLRITLPHADPYLFPLVAVLACFGLVMLYRLDPEFARDQARWFVVGLAVFAATIFALRRDIHVLERYRYVIATVSILLLVLPRVPGIGQEVNGAFLGIGVGPITFQPAELSKIGIVIFLSSYLRDTRQVLVQGARRFAGITIPPLKHLGPLLAVWGLAMLLLVFIRDLGAGLMFFGGFLALIYVATNRLSFPIIGMAMFAVGTWFFASTVGHVGNRVDAWLNPFDDELYDRVGGSYQIAQSLFAQADGGFFGRGFGQAILEVPGAGTTILPAAHTDLIYAVIAGELGLVGVCAVLLTYLLIIERGFRTAMLAGDSFSKLLATGLTAVFALQVFVIVGGVVKLIPLTGVTQPFISYGGSSIVANFILIGLILIVSDRARREVQQA
jgi:cell division protein FtsW (lipid II flippase)